MEVVQVAQLAVTHLERPPAKGTPEGQQRAVGDDPVWDVHRHRDVMGAVARVDGHPFRNGSPVLKVAVRPLVAPMIVLVRNDIEHPVVEREHVVAPCLLPPERNHLRHLLGEFGRQVPELRDILADVIELPHIVVPGCVGPQAVVVDRADRMIRHGLPTIMVDRTRSEHLEVLGDVTARLPLSPLAERSRRSSFHRGGSARCHRSLQAA